MPGTATVTENANTPEALLQEQRAGVVGEIHSNLEHILDNEAELADLMILRDVLLLAHMNKGNMLTGMAATLNRDRSDAVWVRFQDADKVRRYVEQLEAPTEEEAPATVPEQDGGVLEEELHTNLKLEVCEQLETLLKSPFVPTTRDLMVLRDVLMWAQTNNSNILTGFGVTVGRRKHDAVWVHPDLFDSVQTFAEKLEEAEIEKSEWNERWALISRVIDLPQYELQDVSWALDAIERDYGSGTPEEEFVTSILMMYGMRQVEPGPLNMAIVKLSENLQDIARDAAHFAKRFPDGYSVEDNQWPTLETQEEVAAHTSL